MSDVKDEIKSSFLLANESFPIWDWLSPWPISPCGVTLLLQRSNTDWYSWDIYNDMTLFSARVWGPSCFFLPRDNKKRAIVDTKASWTSFIFKSGARCLVSDFIFFLHTLNIEILFYFLCDPGLNQQYWHLLTGIQYKNKTPKFSSLQLQDRNYFLH